MRGYHQLLLLTIALGILTGYILHLASEMPRERVVTKTMIFDTETGKDKPEYSYYYTGGDYDGFAFLIGMCTFIGVVTTIISYAERDWHYTGTTNEGCTPI